MARFLPHTFSDCTVDDDVHDIVILPCRSPYLHCRQPDNAEAKCCGRCLVRAISSELQLYHEHLIVGNIRFYLKKRSLLKFKDPPSSCKHIVWAKMYIYFVTPHCPSWIQCPYFARTLQVHQVLKSWKEAEATTTKRLNNAYWKKPWLALDDSDAYSHPAGPSVTMYPNRPASFIEFDVTDAVQNWNSGQANHGLIVWATNENIKGRSLRFASNANKKYGHAFINVHCKM